jgi:hypothetical protein
MWTRDWKRAQELAWLVATEYGRLLLEVAQPLDGVADWLQVGAAGGRGCLLRAACPAWYAIMLLMLHYAMLLLRFAEMLKLEEGVGWTGDGVISLALDTLWGQAGCCSGSAPAGLGVGCTSRCLPPTPLPCAADEQDAGAVCAGDLHGPPHHRGAAGQAGPAPLLCLHSHGWGGGLGCFSLAHVASLARARLSP